MSKRYKYYQPNAKDLKDQYPDCVIRAISKYLDSTWLDAFDGLIVTARKIQNAVSSIENVELYLKERGEEYVKIYKPKAKHKTTVADFARQNNRGTYVLNVRVGYGTHLVTIVDGIYYDTWDCGDRIVYGYWKKTS